MTAEFPNDENGDVLRRMQENGDDLSQPRTVEFTVVFASESSAEEFADHFRRLGHIVSVRQSNCVPDLPWDVVVENDMLPSHEGITQFEKELERSASGLGGRNDGWGCFVQKDQP